MTALLERLIDRSAIELLLVVAAAVARLGPLIWLAPFFGGRLVPPTVRIGLSVALACVMLPQLLPAGPALADAGAVGVAAVFVQEALVGTALGFVVASVFWAAQAAGGLIDTARGASMGEVMVPQLGGRTTPMGNLLLQLTVVLFLALGGHRIAIAAICRSYVALPLGRFVAIDGLGRFALFCVDLSGEIILVALALAAPVIAAVVLADVALGWINRFAPQINVFFIAMPLKALLGIAVVALGTGVIAAVLPETLERSVLQIYRALSLLSL